MMLHCNRFRGSGCAGGQPWRSDTRDQQADAEHDGRGGGDHGDGRDGGD